MCVSGADGAEKGKREGKKKKKRDARKNSPFQKSFRKDNKLETEHGRQKLEKAGNFLSTLARSNLFAFDFSQHDRVASPPSDLILLILFFFSPH
jgi:hypothetical protein